MHVLIKEKSPNPTLFFFYHCVTGFGECLGKCKCGKKPEISRLSVKLDIEKMEMNDLC